MKKTIYILILTVFALGASAQYNPDKVTRKAYDLYTNALNHAGDGDFVQAIKIMQSAVKLDPNFLDAYLSLGGLYGELKDYQNAVTYYEKARDIDSV